MFKIHHFENLTDYIPIVEHSCILTKVIYMLGLYVLDCM